MMRVLFHVLAYSPASPSSQPASPDGSRLAIVGLGFALLVFWVVLLMGNRKRSKQVDEMIGNLKKNDRVVTIGGIKGTVISTKDDEVVVKVDESTNTKLTFVRKAIQRVIREDE